MFSSRFDAIFFNILSYFHITCRIFTLLHEVLKLTSQSFVLFSALLVKYLMNKCVIGTHSLH